MTLIDLLVDSLFILAPYSGPRLPCFVFPQQLVYQSLLWLSREILLPCWDGIQLHHLGLQLLNVFFYAPEISSTLEGHSNWSLQKASLSGLQQKMDGSGRFSMCKEQKHVSMHLDTPAWECPAPPTPTAAKTESNPVGNTHLHLHYCSDCRQSIFSIWFKQ